MKILFKMYNLLLLTLCMHNISYTMYYDYHVRSTPYSYNNTSASSNTLPDYHLKTSGNTYRPDDSWAKTSHELRVSSHHQEYQYSNADVSQCTLSSQMLFEKLQECLPLQMDNVSTQDSSKLQMILFAENEEGLAGAKKMLMDKAHSIWFSSLFAAQENKRMAFLKLASDAYKIKPLETTKLLFDVMSAPLEKARATAHKIETRKMSRRSQHYIDFNAIQAAQEILEARPDYQEHQLGAMADLEQSINSWSEHLFGEKSELYQKRIDAATEVQENNISFEQHYTLNRQARSMLRDFGKDCTHFSRLYGNALQHVLHEELVSTLNRIAPLQDKCMFGEAIFELNKFTVKALDVGIGYNQLNQVGMTGKISSLCDHATTCLEVLIGVCEGVYDGVKNTAHMVIHPIETVQNIAQGTGIILAGILREVIEQESIQIALDHGDLDKVETIAKASSQRLDTLVQAIKTKYDESSARDISRGVTGFVTELYLQGKLLGAAHEYLKYAHGKIPKVLAHVKDLRNTEELLVTAEGVTFYVADETAAALGKTGNMHLQDAQKAIGGGKKNIINSGKVLSEEVTLLNSFYKKFTTELEQALPKIREAFDLKRKGFGEFATKFIKIDYKHILGFDLHITRKGIPKLGGLHHDFMSAIENSGIVKFTNKVSHKNGFYKVDVLVNGRLFRDKTFFPANWSRKQVISTIYEAYDNFVLSGVQAGVEKGGKYMIESIANDGTEILMFVTKNGLITSAYPILK